MADPPPPGGSTPALRMSLGLRCVVFYGLRLLSFLMSQFSDCSLFAFGRQACNSHCKSRPPSLPCRPNRNTPGTSPPTSSSSFGSPRTRHRSQKRAPTPSPQHHHHQQQQRHQQQQYQHQHQHTAIISASSAPDLSVICP